MQEQLILNRYRPISEAGSGGFATVQLAWDTRIQRRVAIKCIELDEEDLAQGALPGLDEARTAAMLNDGTIVGVYDFEVQGSTAYLIMEYVDGITLTELIDQYNEQLTLNVIAAIFASVSRALEIAHDNQVLHLDIKPDNILINRQGQVKVSDFGLATLSDAIGFGSAAGGTIGYMPPEQMRRENLDVRCDEWSLASVTYEMISGTNPFFAANLQSAQSAILDAELVLPSLCKEGLRSEADDILFYALDPERDERYGSVTEFAEELEQFLGNPVQGQRELAMLVGQACEDFEEEEDALERVSIFDRLSSISWSFLNRIWSVLSVGLLGFVALGNISFVGGFGSIAFWTVLVLLLIAAILKPHLGTLLGLLGLSFALGVNDAIVAAVFLGLASLIWWFFSGRHGDAEANTALAPILFGAIGLGSITPLLSGFFLNTREVLINTAFALFLSVIFAAFGSNSLLGWNLSAWNIEYLNVESNITVLLQQSGTWLIVASWILSALIVRLFCLRQTRLFAFFGMIIATAFLLGGLCVESWLDTQQWMPMWSSLAPLVGSGLIMALLCGLGVPPRNSYEEENYASEKQ